MYSQCIDCCINTCQVKSMPAHMNMNMNFKRSCCVVLWFGWIGVLPVLRVQEGCQPRRPHEDGSLGADSQRAVLRQPAHQEAGENENESESEGKQSLHTYIHTYSTYIRSMMYWSF